MLNALTVDVEEWFHICGMPALGPETWSGLPSRVDRTTRLLLDDLDAAGITGTFFVVGWVAERYPELVAAILTAGHEVGSHSFWHRRVYELDRATFAADLTESVRALNAAGRFGVGVRAPSGRSTGGATGRSRRWCGRFTVDASMAPVRIVGMCPPVGGICGRPGRSYRRVLLVADRSAVMPMGWGWGLRMSAPSRVLKEIERANQAGRPAVLTIHPWEIDPDPPRVALPPGLRFAHYFRLNGFRGRLRAILRGGSFGPLRGSAALAPLSSF